MCAACRHNVHHVHSKPVKTKSLVAFSGVFMAMLFLHV